MSTQELAQLGEPVTRVRMAILLLVLFACSPSPAEHAPTAPAAPAASPFDQKAFLCCDAAEASSVVNSYLAVQRALAKDDAATAAATAAALAKAATELSAAAATTPADRALLAPIVTAAGTVAGTDLPASREAFKPVSTAVLAFARAHPGGAVRLAEAFCPMASANWAQTEATISNPYYGSEMLTCGSFR